MQPPIILGMLWPGGSVLNQAFWQISNQGYNAAVFFANKNKSSEVDDSEVMMSTAGSIAAALALSIGAVKVSVRRHAHTAARRHPYPCRHQACRHPRRRARPPRSHPSHTPSSAVASLQLGDVSGNAAIRSSAGFVGCVGAGWASLVMMRKDELQNGVNVVDDEGTVHGKSKTAAREGIAKCAASRVVWNLPATGITPFLCAAYTKSAMNKAMPMMNLPATTAIITCGIIAGVVSQGPRGRTRPRPRYNNNKRTHPSDKPILR